MLLEDEGMDGGDRERFEFDLKWSANSMYSASMDAVCLPRGACSAVAYAAPLDYHGGLALHACNATASRGAAPRPGGN